MTINYSKQVLLKRGNTAVSTTYTGPVGEITLDTDLLQIRVHDGTTQGGWVIPSGQDFIDIQTDLAIIANVDTSLLANVSTLLANANVQQTQIDNVISNLAELVTVGNTVPSTANETFWFNDGDGRLYIKQANVWTDASPSVLPSPAYIFSTLENTAGNIVPDASNVYSLGSSVAQWKDLWVSNATIYFNSVPLSTDVTGNLTYAGNPLVSFVDGNLSVGGTVVSGGGGGAANIGNVTFDNTTIIGANDSIYFQPNVAQPWLTWGIQNNVFGANSTALIAPASDDQHQGQLIFPGANGMGFGALAWAGNIGSPFDNSLVVAGLLGNVSIGTQDGITGYYWKFGTDGATTLPAVIDGDTTIGTLFNTNPPGHTLTIKHNGGTNGGSGGELKFDYGNVKLKVVQDAGITQTWEFDTDGHLTLPYGSRLVTFNTASVELTAGNNASSYASLASFNGNTYMWVDNDGAYIATNWNPSAKQWTFGTAGNLTLPNDGVISAGGSGGLTLGGNYDVKIVSDYTDNNRTWTFNGTDGSVTFPDTTVQTTAWSGGRVVSAPAGSEGAAGDQQGDIAFTNSHLYYCKEDFVVHTSSVVIDSTEWGGAAGTLTSLPFLSVARAPEIGWTINANFNTGPASLTITGVTPLGDNRYQIDFNSVGEINVSNGNTGTLVDNDPAADIWVRSAWDETSW